MPDTMADRRNAPRYPMILVAEIRELHGDVKLSARTSDLSRTGCYVDTLNPFPQGSSVRIKLSRDDETFDALGKVMYVSQGLGMGIHFEESLPTKQLATLERWLQWAAQHPE
jgi:hypothetical protein